MVAADHVLFDDTDYCLQMDDNDELDTIVMEDEDEAEVKEEDEEQELIIIPFKETCSKHIRGFRRHSCLYKYRLICAWQQDSRQTCTSENISNNTCQTKYVFLKDPCLSVHHTTIKTK